MGQRFRANGRIDLRFENRPLGCSATTRPTSQQRRDLVVRHDTSIRDLSSRVFGTLTYAAKRRSGHPCAEWFQVILGRDLDQGTGNVRPPTILEIP